MIYAETKQAMRVRGNSMLNEPSAVVILMPRSTGYTSLGSGIGQGHCRLRGTIDSASRQNHGGLWRRIGDLDWRRIRYMFCKAFLSGAAAQRSSCAHIRASCLTARGASLDCEQKLLKNAQGLFVESAHGNGHAQAAGEARGLWIAHTELASAPGHPFISV